MLYTTALIIALSGHGLALSPCDHKLHIDALNSSALCSHIEHPYEITHLGLELLLEIDLHLEDDILGLDS